MLPIKRKSTAPSWMCLYAARLGIPLIIIAVLTITAGSTACTKAADPAGKVFRDCATCPEMVIIPPGTFIMGSPETEKDRDADEGQHTVVIAIFVRSKQSTDYLGSVGACVSRPRVRRPLRGSCTQIRPRRQANPELCRPCPWQSSSCRRQLVGCTGLHPLAQQQDWQRDNIAFCRNRNSNMRPAQALPRFIGGATNRATIMLITERMPVRIWEGWLKGETNGKTQHLRYVHSRRMLSAYATCMAMSISGWKIATNPNGARLPADGSAVKSGNCSVRGFRSNSFESNAKTLRSANRAYVYAPDTRGRSYLGFRVAKTIK